MTRLLVILLVVLGCEPKPPAAVTTPEHDAGQAATCSPCVNLEALGCGPLMFPGQTCTAAWSHLRASGHPSDKLCPCWSRATTCAAALRCQQ